MFIYKKSLYSSVAYVVRISKKFSLQDSLICYIFSFFSTLNVCNIIPRSNASKTFLTAEVSKIAGLF